MKSLLIAWLLVVVVVLLVGCGPADAGTEQSAVHVFDVGDGVKCYKYARNHGFDCVKVN